VGRLPYYTEDGVTFMEPPVGYASDLMSSYCEEVQGYGCNWSQKGPDGQGIVHFDEIEIGVDIREWPAVMRTLNHTFNSMPAPASIGGMVFRLMPNSHALMSMAHDSPDGIIAFETTYLTRVDLINQPTYGLGAYQAVTQALIKKHGGRPHWGKNSMHWFTHPVLISQYKRNSIKRFRKTMREYDRTGVFLNKFANRILGLDDKMDVNPAAIHCALRQNCLCGKDADCANNAENAQTCTTFNDVDGEMSYNICKDSKLYWNPPLPPYDASNSSTIVGAIMASYGLVG